MRAKPAILGMMLCAGGVFASSYAHAERASYRSAHPIPDELPGSFCHIDAPHTHTYTVESESAGAFVEHEAQGETQMEFVGDPTNFGYEGPVAGYGEGHPLHFKGGSDTTDQSCTIEGAHFHLHEPFDLSEFEDYKGSYYFGSYKAAQKASSELRKLRKAEAKELKKAERLRRKEAASAARAARSSSSRSRSSKSRTKQSRGSKTKASTSKAVAASTTKRTPAKAAKAPPKKAKPKASKKPFRSWMDRRRGR